MQVERGTIHATVLCVLLGSIACGAAVAAEAYPGSSGSPQSLPAVDGLNAKASAFGGAAKDRAVFGGEGSVTVPLGFRYGFQLDGLAAGLDSSQGDVTSGGTAGHLFWRDPSVGLLGAYGHYLRADGFGDPNLFAGGAEGALYLGRFALEGVAGADGGDVDVGAFGNISLDARFFDVASFSYYPTDNLRLSVAQARMLGVNFALFGAEWGFAAGGKTMGALYARGSVSEDGDGAVFGGLRFYFGENPKSLIRRHREDDPSVMAFEAAHRVIITPPIVGADIGLAKALIRSKAREIASVDP